MPNRHAFFSKMNEKIKGKFIVIYGINNLGKSTQAKILVERLNNEGIKTEYLKYPIYDLQPSGPTLNNYLRGGNLFRLAPRETQILYTLNRTQYQKELENKLEQGINIIAEDYTGTGLAWGIGAGVDEQFLKYTNQHLLAEDLVILLDGERFSDAVEKNHQHEENDELTNKVRLVHLRLAEEKSWHIINANQPIEKIHNQIFKKVKKVLDIKQENDLEDLIKTNYPDDKITSKNKVVEITTINPAITDIKNIAITPKIITPPVEIKEQTSPTKINGNPPSPKNFSVTIQKTNPDAKLPTRTHENDAGINLYADKNYTLYENERTLISTGIKMVIPDGHAGLIYDKNGVAATGLKTAGGVIDSRYKGEIKVLVINLSGNIYNIKKGQNIAQILIQEIKTPDLVESGELNESERANGSFDN